MKVYFNDGVKIIDSGMGYKPSAPEKLKQERYVLRSEILLNNAWMILQEVSLYKRKDTYKPDIDPL